MRGPSFGGGSYGLGRNPGGGGGFNGGEMMRTVGRVMRTRINGIQDPFPSSSSSSSSTAQQSKKSSSSTKSRNNGGTSKHALCISSPVGSDITSNNNSGANNSNKCVPLAVPAAWSSSCPYFAPAGVGVDVDGEIDEEWEYLEDYYDPVFGVAPSPHEVQHALSSLSHVLHPVLSPKSDSEVIPYDGLKEIDQMSNTSSLQRTSSMGSERDWVEPSMRTYDQRLAPYCGWETVYNAFHLLQTEPSVQKMVVSLSSDKAVWDAVLNNEIVREIRESYLNAAEIVESPDDNPEPSTNPNVLKWIMDNMKGKLLEVIGNISQFVGNIFKPFDPEKVEDQAGDQTLVFSDKLKSSFLLTIVVLLIVVVSRGTKA